MKALCNVAVAARQAYALPPGGPGSPLLALQTVLQLCDPGLQLHHQPLLAGPVGTFQVDDPAL